MTTTAVRPSAPPIRFGPPWVAAIASGAAVLLAGLPVRAVVQGWTWFGDAAVVVAAVVAVGLLLHRAGVAAVAAGQGAAVLLLLTALHTDVGVFGLLPGPATWRAFGALVAGAGSQISVGIAPVPSTPEITFLVTAAFGLVALGVHLAAVGADAPAAGGVPLLAMFAVPAALSDDLLPWWALVGAAAGFGLLLVARGGARRQLPGGTALIAGAVALALGIGAVTGFVGTSGRFDGNGGGGAGGSIGLSPFTSLRGQLDQSQSTELFRVRGLPQPTYLRALTLRDYVPNAGWQATRPDPGPSLPGTIDPSFGGDVTTVDIQNIAFRDYWLPLYGRPVAVGGLPTGQWTFDARSATAYTARPREDGSWRQLASFAAPTAAQLRAATGRQSPSAEYLNVAGVDPRVTALAQQVVKGAPTAFDRTMALQDFFTGPSSPFRYSLQTAPGAGDDALVEFLTVGKAGYCEQFASAMAVMLRTVGVPARVAVGFTGGRDVDGYRSVGTSDAHAWVEAWYPGIGWTTFDPTPLTDGRTITPPYVSEARSEATDPNGAGADSPAPPGAADSTAPTTAPPAPKPDKPDVAAATPADTGTPAWPFVAGGAVLVAVLVALLPAALRARTRRRRLAMVDAGGPDAAAAAWEELLAASEDREVAIPSSDTVRAGARRLVREHDLDDGVQQALREVVGAVEASWYGGGRAGVDLSGPVRTVLGGIAAARTPSLRERLLPRSITTRRPRPRVEDDAPAPVG